MKKSIFIGMATAIAFALIASSALALGAGYGRGTGYGPGYYGCQVSNLTPEQAAKIQGIQQANLKEISPLQQQLMAKKMELRGLWLTKDPDQGKVNTLQKDILDLQGKLQEKSTNTRFEIRKVLTPEQQAQLTAYGPVAGYGKGRMGGRMGRR